MANPKAPWQQLILLDTQTTSIVTPGTFLSSDIGVETGKPGIQVLNGDFSLAPEKQFIEERLATGISNLKKGAAADAIEHLGETNFASHALWDVTGVCVDSGGDAEWTFGGGTLVGTLTQTAGNRVNRGDNYEFYSLTYTVSVTLAPDGDFELSLGTFSDETIPLPYTAGTHTVHFMSAAAANAASFVISTTETTSSQGQFAIDDISLKKLGSLQLERRSDILRPTVTLEFPANAYIMKAIFWLFFQKGTTEAGATPYVTTCIPYTANDCEVWASLADPVTGALATGKNEAMHGVIVKSFTLTSEEGGQAKVSVEFVGCSYSEIFNTVNAVMTVSGKPGLLHRNLKVELDDNTIYTPSLSITFSHDVFSPSYNSGKIKKHILQDLMISGEITVPRDSGTVGEDAEAQITDLLAGDDKKLELYWGAIPAAQEGDLAFLCDILYKSKEKTSEGEVGNRLPFEGVAGSNNVSLTVADAIDRGIP